MQLLRKISRATMIPGGDTAVLELVMANKEKTVPLYRVGGSCNGSRKGESDYGEWECLIGNFQAINLETGEVSRSGQCFLPQFAVDTIVGQFDAEVTAVKFAYDVGVKFDPAFPPNMFMWWKALFSLPAMIP